MCTSKNRKSFIMKKLEDYSEEIYKCTKCGLCQSVCPVFEATGLETAVSRGKFTALHGVINGKIPLNKNVAKYLDLCLGCNACSEFCPSGIQAEEIILTAKHKSFQLNGISFLKKFIISNFESRANLTLLKVLLNIYKRSGFIQLSDFIANGLGRYGFPVKLFNKQLKENIQYKKLTPAKPASDLKIVYFPGCINNYVNQSVKNSVLMVLEKNGFNVIIPKNLACCGIPARNSGDMNSFFKLAKSNLSQISDDIDVLLTDCATCGTVWELYKEISDPIIKEKAEKLTSKAVNINKFLTSIDLYIPDNAKINKKVTYHDPCHLNRFQKVSNEPRELLKKIPGIEFIEMKNADKCCGAAGTFCIANSEISQKISEEKAQNIINTEAQIASTSCPSCNIGLYQGLINKNKDIPVHQPIELLAELYLL